MRRFISCLVVLGFSVTAFAQEAEEEGGFLPHQHQVQIALEAPPMLNATTLTVTPGVGTITRGLGVGVLSANGQTVTAVGFGLNGGAGYLLTDLVELGGALAIDVGTVSSAGSASAVEFALEPFVKVNLGRMMKLNPRVNPYGYLGIAFGGVVVGGQGGALFSMNLAPGIEFMITKNWGLNGYIPITIGVESNVVSFGFGLGYGMVAYF